MCKAAPRTRVVVKRLRILSHPEVRGHPHPPPAGLLIVRVGWQSNSDIPTRRRILNYIQMMVANNIASRPDVHDLLHKIPSVSSAAEVLLYHWARTKEEYMDLSTLRHRLYVLKRAVDSFDGL